VGQGLNGLTSVPLMLMCPTVTMLSLGVGRLTHLRNIERKKGRMERMEGLVELLADTFGREAVEDAIKKVRKRRKILKKKKKL